MLGAAGRQRGSVRDGSRDDGDGWRGLEEDGELLRRGEVRVEDRAAGDGGT